ncbi:MAG: hypothetical protein ABFS56_21650 [Pseudomonadota bacterium]
MFKKVLAVVLVFVAPTVFARGDVLSTIGYAGIWGNWGGWQYCPPGTFAAGYAMKVEHSIGKGDDTAVNGIKLYCVNTSGEKVANITSLVGPWGSWREGANCHKTAVFNGSSQSFEPSRKDQDDTATNSVRFKCTDGKTIQAAGSMPWGKWGPHVSCPDKEFMGLKIRTAICGIQTRVEPSIDGDDTALNGANYACCAYKQY